MRGGGHLLLGVCQALVALLLLLVGAAAGYRLHNGKAALRRRHCLYMPPRLAIHLRWALENVGYGLRMQLSLYAEPRWMTQIEGKAPAMHTSQGCSVLAESSLVLCAQLTP